MRKLVRRVRLVSWLPAALWVYRNRREVSRALQFLVSVPEKARAGRWQDVSLEGRVRLALAADDELRNGPVEVGAVEDHAVTLCGPSGDTRTERARRLVQDVPGVASVRVENPDPIVLPSEPVRNGPAMAKA